MRVAHVLEWLVYAQHGHELMAGLENLWVILGLFRYWLSELQEPAEASAGGIKGALLRFGGVVDEGATVIVDGAREDLGHGLLT